jgi:hypothetical protein
LTGAKEKSGKEGKLTGGKWIEIISNKLENLRILTEFSKKERSGQAF